MKIGVDPFHLVIALAVLGALGFIVWVVTQDARNFIRRGRDKRPGYITDQRRYRGRRNRP